MTTEQEQDIRQIIENRRNSGYDVKRVEESLLTEVDRLRIKIEKLICIVQDHAEGGNIENYGILSDKLEEELK